jgi:hypothetical protein
MAWKSDATFFVALLFTANLMGYLVYALVKWAQ